jgi:pilus assembly protein CpaB
MQRKGFFLLALICGLIAAGSMYIYLNGATRNSPATLKPLVIVKTNIPARSVIVASQLEVKDVPTQGYPQGGYSTIQNVVGSVALLNLSAGDLIVSTMLERQNSQNPSKGISTGSTTALTVPEGKRALAIPIGLVSGVGYAVKPGDHVDILVTMEIKDSTAPAVIATTLVAQDVLVLSVGESITGDKAKVDTKYYTLALSVPQAMVVTFGSEKGSLRLLLRNPANSEIRQDAPVNGNVFLDPNYINRFK